MLNGVMRHETPAAGKDFSEGDEQEVSVPISQAVVICGFGELGQTVAFC